MLVSVFVFSRLFVRLYLQRWSDQIPGMSIELKENLRYVMLIVVRRCMWRRKGEGWNLCLALAELSLVRGCDG